MTRVVVIGDALLDRDLDGVVERIAPDAPVPVVELQHEAVRPGGAALAAALLAADGAEVTLVAALADDPAGTELRGLLEGFGVEVQALTCNGATPEKIRVRAGGRPLVRVDRGDRRWPSVGPLPAGARRALAVADAVLVSDYGGAVAASDDVRRSIVARSVPVVWDPHPRGSEPTLGARLVTPNAAEARHLVDTAGGDGTAAVAARADALVHRWHATGVVVTRGERGALLATASGPPLAVPPPRVVAGDPCGAGDRFAGVAALELARGRVLSEAVQVAVHEATSFVAAGGASAFLARGADSLVPPAIPRVEHVRQFIDAVRARGGVVVATGGCFDLLHAGHVAMLQAARRLGDCLVVLLNSDASVARLKGPSRPVQHQGDRAALLKALDCVDAVVVFDDDTPVGMLEQLRPDIFVKGADYAIGELPEAAAMARWSGQAVVVPYLDGRSTTRLIEEATRRAST